MNRIPPPSSSPTCGQWRRAAGSQAVPHASCTTSILGSRLCKVTQDAYSQLNYSAALQGKRKKKKNKKPPHTLLPARLRTHQGAPAVGATRAVAPRCPKPPEPTGWGIGSRRRAEKGRGGGEHEAAAQSPELKPSLSSRLQMGQQLRCRRAAGRIIAALSTGGSWARLPRPTEGERGPQPLRGHSAGIYLQPRGSF